MYIKGLYPGDQMMVHNLYALPGYTVSLSVSHHKDKHDLPVGQLWRRVYEAYTGSIGRWKRAVRDRSIVDAFNNFQERRAAELAEDFLRANGIEPAWR